MKHKRLLITLAAIALLATSLSVAHAYANQFQGFMDHGQWQAKSLSLGNSPYAWTRVHVRIFCQTLTDPPADFDVYLVDQWGYVRARGISPGSDNITALMPGTHCTLWIHCPHIGGGYSCSVAVDNGPVAP
jgi:hypothetical protein